jgi:DOMON domain/Eukaryotic cytochrome b561
MKFNKFASLIVLINTVAGTSYVNTQDGKRILGEYSGGSNNDNTNRNSDNVTARWNNNNTTNTSSQVKCYSNSVVTEGDITIRSVHNVEDDTYSIEMTYNGKGWIGFGLSNTGLMVPSKAVIGLPDTGIVSSYNMTSKSLAGVTKFDSPLTLTETSIVQNDTHTVLAFTKPLVDWKEFIASTTASNSYIWAVGSSNELGWHGQRGSGSIMLYPCNQGEVTSGNVPTNNTTDVGSAVPGSNNNNVNGAVKKSLTVADGITVDIQTNTIDQSATFEMTYEGVAWIAIAFSTTGQMIGSPAVIGLTSADTPQKYDMTSKSGSGVTLASATVQGALTDTIFLQNTTHTYMKFKRPLVNSGMPDILVDGSENVFLYGIGSNNNLGYHSKRGNFKVSLSACDPSTSANCNTFTQGAGVNTRTWWLGHGICMGIAWVIFVPLAVGASLLRKLLPAGALWFTIHRALNMTGIALTIIGFILAIGASNKEGTPHFKSSLHQKIGLSIFILALVQAINGVLRPHVPSQSTNITTSTATKQGEENYDTTDNVEDTAVVNNQDNNNHIVIKKSNNRIYWEIGHRIIGVVLLGLAWYNCYTGINKYETRFDDDYTVVFWSMLGAIIGSILLLVVYQYNAFASSSA